MVLRTHNKTTYLLSAILTGIGLALAPAHAREPNGETASNVRDAGMAPASIRMEAVTTEGTGDVVGTIRARQLVHGVLFEPALKGLEPGLHGFHIHENGGCNPAPTEGETSPLANVVPAGQAGDHWDPGANGHHAGPWGRGHLGDLPNLYVNSDGVAALPVYAPRITLSNLERRALVVHGERDNYQSEPDSKGGSGPAVACGVWGGGRD